MIQNDSLAGTDDAGLVLLGAAGSLDLAGHLARAGSPILDAEPAPQSLSDALAARYGFRHLSARTGEVGSPGALAAVVRAAASAKPPAGWVWTRADGRLIDGLRPDVEPHGVADAAELAGLRAAHAQSLVGLLRGARRVILCFGETACAAGPDGALFPRLPQDGVSSKGGPLSQRLADLSLLEQDFIDLTAALGSLNPELKISLVLLPRPAPGATDFAARLPNLRQQSDLRVMMAHWAATHPGVTYLPLWEMCTGSLMARGEYDPATGALSPAGGAAVAALCLGRDVVAPEINARVAPGEGKGDKKARRARRRADRAAREPKAASVICEDELLEAFST